MYKRLSGIAVLAIAVAAFVTPQALASAQPNPHPAKIVWGE